MVAPLKLHVSIPTLNSANTLELAIDSILTQKYKYFSCNVVDSYSNDKTQSIAKKKGIDVVLYKGKLLGARYEGFIRSDCDYAIFMDSDQVLGKDTLERLSALLLEKKPDMVILEEHSYRKKTLVEKMYDLDRTLVQRDFKYNLSSERGVLLPRVFKKSLLKDAFKRIDPTLYPEVVAHDHAIIYYECSKISQRIEFLKDAIFHQEIATLKETFWHFVNYGKNAREFEQMGLYSELIRDKMRGRNSGFLRNLSFSKIAVTPLLLAKAAGYYWGYRYGNAWGPKN